MELIPIQETEAENANLLAEPLCRDTIYMALDFYKKIGFTPPWICYYVKQDGQLVASCGFKGKPFDNTVEIAYGTFEKYRNQGIGAKVCRLLVDVVMQTDPAIRITARTLPEKNFSTRILQKNNFEFNGTCIDPEDGQVWEWVFKPK